MRTFTLSLVFATASAVKTGNNLYKVGVNASVASNIETPSSSYAYPTQQ